MVNKKSFETGRISIVRVSRGVLVKVMFFYLRGCGHPQSHAMPKIIKSFNCHYSDLSNEVYNVSVSYRGQEKLSKTSRW